MQFTTQSILYAVLSTSLVASVSGAPAPTSKNPIAKRLARGQVDCQGSHSTNSQAIPTGSGFGWSVFIGEPIGLQEGGECGDNFLNYLRAQSGACATVTSWECSPVSEGEGGENIGIFTTFDTNIFCGAGQIQKAIWDATNPQLENVCANHGSDVSAEDVLGAVLGTLEGLGGFVGGGIRSGA